MLYNMPNFVKFVNDNDGTEFIFQDQFEMSRVLRNTLTVKSGTVYQYVNGVLDEDYKITLNSQADGRWHNIEVVL